MKKVIILLLTLLILFPLNYVPVFAENIGEGINGCPTYYVVGADGNNYCVPTRVIGTQWEDRYKNIVGSGLMTEQDSDFYKFVAYPYGDNVVNNVGIYLDDLMSGRGLKDSIGLFKCLLDGNVAKSKYGYACDFNKIAGDYVPNIKKNPDSGYRNYYTQPSNNNNIYNGGDTYNYKIDNTYNKTIGYYTNNTYNSFNYDIKYYNIFNDNYEYTYNNNQKFIITNNIDNSTVNIINDSGVSTYKFYYQLPDGKNSFNLTEEDIKGYQLDFHVKNYDNITDNTDVLKGLYHFEQNLKNSAYDKNYNVNFSTGTVQFLNDSSTQFDSYGYYSSQTALFYGSTENVETIDFRFKPIYSTKFKLQLNYKDLFSSITENKQRTEYVTQTTTQEQIVKERGHTPQGGVLKCRNGVKVSSTSYQETTQAYPGGPTSTVVLYELTCKVQVKTTTQVPNVINYTETSHNNYAKKINYGAWNHLAITDFKDGTATIYLNGKLLTDSFPFNYDPSNFYIIVEQYGSFGVDELRISKEKYYTGEFSPPVRPYDNDIIYTLPEVEENNTILIQSRIKVNSQQFGGIRNSNPKTGDVFVSTVESGTVQAIEQFDGSDWIEVQASIYNEYLKKWVNLKGYNFLKDKTQLEPTPVPTPGDSPGVGSGGVSESFLEKWFNVFVEIFKNFTPNKIFKEAGTNFWDFLIEIVKAIPDAIGKLGDAFIGLFGSVADLIKWIFEKFVYLLIPSEEFWKNLHVPDFKLNLGILYTPFELLGGIISSLFNFEKISTSSFIFEWQDIKFYDVVLIPSSRFDFNVFVNSNVEIKRIYDIYLIVVDGVIYFGLLNLIRKKSLKFLNR